MCYNHFSALGNFTVTLPRGKINKQRDPCAGKNNGAGLDGIFWVVLGVRRRPAPVLGAWDLLGSQFLSSKQGQGRRGPCPGSGGTAGISAHPTTAVPLVPNRPAQQDRRGHTSPWEGSQTHWGAGHSSADDGACLPGRGGESAVGEAQIGVNRGSFEKMKSPVLPGSIPKTAQKGPFPCRRSSSKPASGARVWSCGSPQRGQPRASLPSSSEPEAGTTLPTLCCASSQVPPGIQTSASSKGSGGGWKGPSLREVPSCCSPGVPGPGRFCGSGTLLEPPTPEPYVRATASSPPAIPCCTASAPPGGWRQP